MRITNSISTSNYLYSLNQSMERQNTVQEQLTDGKQIHKPSDDPIGMIRTLGYRNQLAENAQYQRNAQDASSWSESTDSALGDMNTILQRARVLATQASSDAVPLQARQGIAAEIDQLTAQLAQVANSKIGDKYIFAGQKTNTQPYSVIASSAVTTAGYTMSVGSYQGNDLPIAFELTPGIKDNFNLTGSHLFGTANDVFKHLLDFSKNLRDPAKTAIDLQTTVSTMATDSDHLLDLRAEVGAKANKVELVQNRMTNDAITMKSDLSKTEDVDVAKAILEMKNEENVYRSALAIGAKILPASLLDFLK